MAKQGQQPIPSATQFPSTTPQPSILPFKSAPELTPLLLTDVPTMSAETILAALRKFEQNINAPSLDAWFRFHASMPLKAAVNGGVERSAHAFANAKLWAFVEHWAACCARTAVELPWDGGLAAASLTLVQLENLREWARDALIAFGKFAHMYPGQMVSRVSRDRKNFEGRMMRVGLLKASIDKVDRLDGWVNINTHRSGIPQCSDDVRAAQFSEDLLAVQGSEDWEIV